MFKRTVLALGLFLLLHLMNTSAEAAGATLIFKSGIKIYINNGYEKVVDAFSKLDSDARHKVIPLDVEGGIFLLDVAEVVVVCKEKCTSMTLEDTRDPSRGR